MVKHEPEPHIAFPPLVPRGLNQGSKGMVQNFGVKGILTRYFSRWSQGDSNP